MLDRALSIGGTTMLAVSVLIAGQLLVTEVNAQQSPSALTIQETIPRDGFSMAFGFGSLWMMSEDRLIRVNATDNSFAEIEIPVHENAAMLFAIDKYRDLAVGEEAVWVPDMASSTIYKIDPALNKVVLAIQTDIFGGEGSIGVGHGSLWVLTFDSRNKSVTRYNAATGEMEAKIALPRASKEIVVDHGAVWIAAARRGELYRIDPAANAVTATISVTGSPRYLSTSEDSIWIFSPDDGVVQRVDGRNGKVVATINVGATDNDGDIVTGGGYVWIIMRRSTVTRIDPASNRLAGVFRGPDGLILGRRLGFGGGSLWVSGANIFRFAPPF